MTLQAIRQRLAAWLNPAAATLDRDALAALYLKGDGIEVGALHNPLPPPEGARVRYVDRMTVADLRRQYPELETTPLVEPDIVDDGEKLTSFADASLDFVIANHFLEHCEDPIATLKSFARVLKPGGILYLAVPDKRFTWDIDRPTTTIEHLVADHEQGPAVSRTEHFREFAGAMHKLAGVPMYEKTLHLLTDPAYLERINYSIHFHVWDHHEFLSLLVAILKRYAIPFEIELALTLTTVVETVAILRKK
ncbi:MAG: class I SAM-dependent methyltransferase [Alphaproteobacteria bacterium]|nr:class I SAM-dependent methyltransferase [Alphaproteobacteria bacterium]